MHHLLGSILVIGGMTGFGILYTEKEKRRIEQLENIAYMFRLLMSEIAYKKQPLPYACRAAGLKIKTKEGEILKSIAEEMELGKGRTFEQIWREKWKTYLEASSLSGQEQMKMTDFSSFSGYEEEELQTGMMEEQMQQFAARCNKVREELEKKKRIILLLSSCTGILLVLILL